MLKDSKYKTANTYATAWFRAALDEGRVKDTVQEVEALLNSIKDDSEVWDILTLNTDDVALQTQIIKDLSQKIKLSQITSNTLLLIVENKRLKLLKLILESFRKLYYKSEGIIEVVVDTVIPLSQTQEKKLKKALETKLKKPVIIDYHIKPEIFGGLMISFNDFQLDDTLYSKLQKMKKLMLEQDVE